MIETVDIEAASSDEGLFPDERLVTTGVLHETQAAVGAAIEKLAVEPSGLDPATADLLVRLEPVAERLG